MCIININNRIIDIPDNSIAGTKQIRKCNKPFAVKLTIKDKYAMKAAIAYLQNEHVSFAQEEKVLTIPGGALEDVFDGQKVTFVIGDNIINYTVKQNMLGRWFLKCEEEMKVNTYIFHLLHIKNITKFCLGNDSVVKGSSVIFPTHVSSQGLYKTIKELKRLCR